jgi:hypothetical protein
MLNVQIPYARLVLRVDAADPEDCERDPYFDGKRACGNACERPIIARELYPEQVRRAALASFDAAVASAAGSSTADAPAVRKSLTTVSDRSSAG